MNRGKVNYPFYVFYIDTREGRKVVSCFEPIWEDELKVGNTIHLKYKFYDKKDHIILINNIETQKDKYGIEVMACFASEIL